MDGTHTLPMFVYLQLLLSILKRIDISVQVATLEVRFPFSPAPISSLQSSNRNQAYKKSYLS